MMLRVPVLMYRLGLAERLGSHGILLLYTTGRRSGLRRVSGLNHVMDGTTVYVAAGWGPRTDWYQNALANLTVEVQIGGQRRTALARAVSDLAEKEQACAMFMAVDQYPPKVLRPLLKRLGLDYEAERKMTFGDPSRVTLMALELAKPLEEQPAEGKGTRRAAAAVAIATLGTALIWLGARVLGRNRR
jgi:deazaflavin-dependent oxidoreductase (nitroreductase family)